MMYYVYLSINTAPAREHCTNTLLILLHHYYEHSAAISMLQDPTPLPNPEPDSSLSQRRTLFFPLPLRRTVALLNRLVALNSVLL